MADTSIDRFLRSRSKSKEPLLAFKWVVTSLPFGLDTTYAEEVNLPFTKLDMKDGLFGAATYTYYPGFSNVDQFSITFHEDSAGTTTNWLLSWMSKIKNFKEGWYYLPKSYKESINLELLDTQNNTVIKVEQFGVWPIVRDPWSLAYSDPSGRLRINVSFAVDDQRITIVGGSGGGAGTGRPGLGSIFSSAASISGGSGSLSIDTRKDYAIFENPLPKFPNGFDVPEIPEIPKPPEPQFMEKLTASIHTGAAARSAIVSRNMKDNVINFGYDNYNLTQLSERQQLKQDFKENLRSAGVREGYAAAVGMTGTLARTLTDNVLGITNSGASQETIAATEKKNESFLGSVVEATTDSTRNFTENLVSSAENADANHLDYPTNMKQAVLSSIDGTVPSYQSDLIGGIQNKANDTYL